MDTELVKKRLAALKAQTSKSSLLWKPEPGDTTIRIVPLKENPDNPFIELYFHFEFGKKSYLSLKTFNEKDPVVQLCEKLRRTGEKEQWKMARKLEPKLRTFVPIVVRGKENEGVKYWGFGKTVYEALMKLVTNPEWGDVSDPVSGHDITVTFQTKEEVGKDFPVTTIQALPKERPLTTNETLLEKLLNDQKSIFDAFPKPTFEELEEALEKYMNPEEEEEAKDVTPEDADATPETPAKPAEKVKPAVQGKTPVSGDVGDAFTALFKKADQAKEKPQTEQPVKSETAKP